METLIAPDMALIRKIAGQAERHWAGYVQADDLEQEGVLWWIGSGQKYVPAYLADDNQVRLSKSLWRVMARYAQKEKAQRVGYLPLDQYRYSPREVAALIGVALDPFGVPQHSGSEEGPKPAGNKAEGGDVLAALIDVRRALDALPEDDLYFLQGLDDVRYDWTLAGELFAIQPKSAQRRHQRVIERMCRWLNNEENYA